MNKKIYVAGSIAYDCLLFYPGNFINLISTSEQVLNLSLNVSEKTIQFGGTAANIAYNLSLLSEPNALVGVVGAKDFKDYKKWLEEHNIDISHINVIEESYSANAYITSDKAGNQITSYYKGASIENLNFMLNEISEEIEILAISPDKKERMLDLKDQARFLNLSCMFDPGQVITEFSEMECLSFLDGPKILIFNQYELKTFMQKTKLTREEILKKVPILIETLRESGSSIMTKNEKIFIKSAPAFELTDATGCGDAYRAGILYGLKKGYDLKKMGQIASLLATYNLEVKGTQNHKFTKQQFEERYEDVYGEKIKLQ